MLLAFLITLIEVKPNIANIAEGFFIPKAPLGSIGLIIAFMASCFSIVGAFYTSYLVQQRKRVNKGLVSSKSKNSSLTGMLLLGLLSAIVMICAAAILQPLGIEVSTAKDMSIALAPAFGVYASAVFLIGLFAAGFSSIVGNASIGGTLLSDALGFGSNFNSVKTKVMIALVMITGATIAIIFGDAPLELIVFAQSVTIFIVPLIGIAMFLIANDKKYMGDDKIKPFLKVSGFIGLLIVVLLAGINFVNIFF